MTIEKLNSSSRCDATIIRGSGLSENMNARGKYNVKCFDSNGNLKWEDEILNTVMTVGKNVALDAFLSGSSYTAASYMGLISSVSYGAGPVAGDTMTSHAGWVEAGSSTNYPLYSGSRKTCVWSSASAGAKALALDTLDGKLEEVTPPKPVGWGAGMSAPSNPGPPPGDPTPLAKPLEAGALRVALGRWARPQAIAHQAFTPEERQDKLAS